MRDVTSFPAVARRVRDPALPLPHRLWALRECTLRFAPFGFRATWHHLLVTARIPQDLAQDPGSLVRALDDLESARAVVLPALHGYAQRRRQEKATGRRSAPPAPRWTQLAYCPDPSKHPSGPLVQVVRTMLAADPTADRCPICATARPAHKVCPECGVYCGKDRSRYRSDPDQ